MRMMKNKVQLKKTHSSADQMKPRSKKDKTNEEQEGRIVEVLGLFCFLQGLRFLFVPYPNLIKMLDVNARVKKRITMPFFEILVKNFATIKNTLIVQLLCSIYRY